MTTDKNFNTIKRVEQETAKKKAHTEQRKNFANQAVSKVNKIQAKQMRKGERICLKNKLSDSCVTCQLEISTI